MVPALATGSSFCWLLFPFGILPSLVLLLLLNTSLLYNTTKCFRLILCIAWSRPRISHFSKKPGSFFWRIELETRIWTQGLFSTLHLVIMNIFSPILILFSLFIYSLFIYSKPILCVLFLIEIKQGCFQTYVRFLLILI